MEPITQRKKHFWKTPVLIILAVIFFPFFFTYWVYKRNWNPKIKWGFMLVFWLLIAIAEFTNTPQELGVANDQKDASVNTAQPTSQAPAANVPSISPSDVISGTYPSFDKNFGNNFISAQYAQNYKNLADNVAPGAIKTVYLELFPVDPTGKTEEAYKKSVSSSSLTVAVNPLYWNIINGSTKKELITLCINSLKDTFSGYPHIIIKDGTRTVATGELPSLGGNPKVTLK